MQPHCNRKASAARSLVVRLPSRSLSPAVPYVRRAATDPCALRFGECSITLLYPAGISLRRRLLFHQQQRSQLRLCCMTCLSSATKLNPSHASCARQQAAESSQQAPFNALQPQSLYTCYRRCGSGYSVVLSNGPSSQPSPLDWCLHSSSYIALDTYIWPPLLRLDFK